MKIIVVTRNDWEKVPGGDMVVVRNIRYCLLELGAQVEIVPVEKLGDCTDVSVLQLTQIYQVQVAEAAVQWAKAKRVPICISPFFEDPVSLGFGHALQKGTKWHSLSKLAGLRFAEAAFRALQMSRRSLFPEWNRQRELLRMAYLIPNSRYELKHLCTWFKMRDVRASIVPLGIDPQVFNLRLSKGLPPLPQVLVPYAGRYILEVGVISSRKNQLGLLRALGTIENPVVFVGRPSPYENAYCQAVHLAAQERGMVFFFQHVSMEDAVLQSLYTNAAVHVLPSWSERPGLVSLEAAACGCKVVCSDQSPIREYLGNDAVYCHPHHPSSIRAAVSGALSTPIPPSLRDRVLTNFSWKLTAASMLSVYEALLS